MSHFTPVSALIGGALIGASCVLCLLLLGRLAGISNIAHATVAGPSQGESLKDWIWRPGFLLGLVLAGWLYVHLQGQWGMVEGHPVAPQPSSLAPLLMVVGGGLVGWGTAQGRGCTSGHGVCGLARLSARSVAATLTFMGTGGLTVFALRHGLHLI